MDDDAYDERGRGKGRGRGRGVEQEERDKGQDVIACGMCQEKMGSSGYVRKRETLGHLVINLSYHLYIFSTPFSSYFFSSSSLEYIDNP